MRVLSYCLTDDQQIQNVLQPDNHLVTVEYDCNYLKQYLAGHYPNHLVIAPSRLAQDLVWNLYGDPSPCLHPKSPTPRLLAVEPLSSA